MNKAEFLSTYNLTETDLQEAEITWEELENIAEEYQKIEKLMHDLGKDFIDEYLYEIEQAGIHSYRYRTKEPGHLLEKIIRKRKESMEKYGHLDHTNYYKYVTDLIGIRVFFLYREDWVHFHRYLTEKFENDPKNYIVDRLNDFDENPDHYYIAEKPKVYKRGGDTKIYDGEEIDIITDGIYRSLHYIVKYKGYYVEIQGRTLFEEGWSEIDHDIVYPYYKDDEMLQDYSKLLNRLSGLADEMSSYFRKIREFREE
ncbi:MAG: GTP pyrophosphokinase [Anaerotignum sp.]|nr:GTP pyrophosphokinase [Anaerotignum sp.]